MKLKRDDTVMVMVGKDKGKTGKVTAVIPAKHQVLVESVNMYKRHTKPSDRNPRGGIIEMTRPIDVSKVMIVDPESGLPARIGYVIKENGDKERIFKVSKQRLENKKKKAKPKKAEVADSKADDTVVAEVKADAKKTPVHKKATEPKADTAPKTVGKDGGDK